MHRVKGHMLRKFDQLHITKSEGLFSYQPLLLIPYANKFELLTPPKLPPPESEFPQTSRILPQVPRSPTPLIAGLGNAAKFAEKLPRKLVDLRGPEMYHNFLIHKQFGIQAVTGGQMDFGHFETVRLAINPKLDTRRMFAEWRVEAPWKPWTRKAVGFRHGGGKGPIDRYVTPIRANRIILEMGGQLDRDEAMALARIVLSKFPVQARFVTQEMLETERRIERYIDEQNMNPITFELALRYNLANIRRWAGPYDAFWQGRYR